MSVIEATITVRYRAHRNIHTSYSQPTADDLVESLGAEFHLSEVLHHAIGQYFTRQGEVDIRAQEIDE